MEKSFNSLAELRAEITSLKIKRDQMELTLQEKFDGPVATIKSISSVFKGASGKSLLEEIFSEDIISNIARFIVPIMLNSSLFKKSGFITKTLVALFSQKAAKKINLETITGLIDKIKELLKKKEKDVKPAIAEYGIPPDSETY